MTEPMQRMVNLIKAPGHSNHYSDIDPNGEHNEGFWARRFEDGILWLYEVN